MTRVSTSPTPVRCQQLRIVPLSALAAKSLPQQLFEYHNKSRVIDEPEAEPRPKGVEKQELLRILKQIPYIPNIVDE